MRLMNSPKSRWDSEIDDTDYLQLRVELNRLRRLTAAIPALFLMRRHVECYLTKSKECARRADTFRDMDPVRNPYAPGAGQRPPELAGRDAELTAFDVALERVERGRPERSLILTGLRGVGKTVLLNALRSKALDRGWGTGKVEARPDTSLRRPLTSALHAAVRELSVRHRAPDRVREVLATLKAFGLRTNPRGGKLIERWTPAIDGPPSTGRADSGGRRRGRGCGRVRRRDAGSDARGRLGALRELP